MFTFDGLFTYMGTNEMAQALGISKAMVSKLTGKGMPLTSPQAAQAWRETNAPPRVWKSKAATPSPLTGSSPITPPRSKSPAPAPSAPAPSVDTTDLPGDAADSPAESLRRSRAAERASYKNLEKLQRDKNASAEDLRKSSQVFFSSRQNCQKAAQDYKQWQRDEGIVLFLSEAQELTNRGHLAVVNMLQGGPKALSPRLFGQSQKSIEKALSDYFDKIQEHLRQSF